jgi:hypothetical protein
MLVGVNSKTFRGNREGKSFTLRLSARLHGKFYSAGHLVRVDDLETFSATFGALSSNQSAEPEDVLLDTEKAGAHNCLSVDLRVETGNNSLFFKDLIEVFSVDARDAGLGSELEGNSVGAISKITVSDIDRQGTVVEFGSLGVECHGDNSSASGCN